MIYAHLPDKPETKIMIDPQSSPNNHKCPLRKKIACDCHLISGEFLYSLEF